MKKMIIVLTSLVLCSEIAVAAPGEIRAISTQELASVCSDQFNPQPQIYCDVYGQGVYDAYLVTRYPKNAPEFICVKQPAPSRREVMNQFVDWIKLNPSYNNSPAADTFLRFLAVRFACDSSAMSPGNAVNKIVR